MNVKPDALSVSKERPPLMSERRVSLIGALMVAVGPISMSLYTPAMPEIVRAFGSTDAAVRLTLSFYFAGFAFAQLVCGPLSDGFGRKPITFGFMGIYLVASVLALFAPNVDVLIAARFLQGVGAAAGIAISRAIVRDLFTHDSSARVMNLISIILSVGPALAPTLGGFTMEMFGWHAVFLLMVAMGIAIVVVTLFFLRETVTRDLSRIRPGALVRSYGKLLTNPYFLCSSLTVAGTNGALYMLATILPFVLMERVGLSPTAFGLGMLMQSGSFFAGSLAVRALLRRTSALSLVPVGLVFVGLGSVLTAIFMQTGPLSFLTVMGPVGLYATGIAFVMPAMMTAAMAPYPRIAGSASAMLGFFQMGGGLAGSAVAVLIDDPVTAMAIVLPGMGTIAILAWIYWRRLPEPAAADVTRIDNPPMSGVS